MQAWINGEDAERTAAVAATAQALAKARRPLILVDAIDLAGAAAAVELGLATGAVLAHREPMGVTPFQQSRFLGTTPGEAHLRADTVLFVGDGADAAAAAAGLGGLTHPGETRKVLHLRSGNAGPERLVAILGALRALAAGRPVSPDDALAGWLRPIAEELKQARYGVAIAAPDCPGLALESLFGLVDELSARHRFTVLALGRPPGQWELLRVCLAMAGLPPPLDLAGPRLRSDAFLFAPDDLVARGGVDAALWLSTRPGAPPPGWLAGIPVAALCPGDAPLPGIVAQIVAGSPGSDASGLVFEPRLGAVTAVSAREATGRPPLAELLRAVRDALAMSREAAA
jgi:formylmethanofuran dehydrogenase subunit B